MTDGENKSKIRELNDRFRKSFERSLGRVILTPGVESHSKRTEIIERVRNFDDFSSSNDPHDEHDMGFFSIGADKFTFKIDYYDNEYEMGSEDPSDVSSCRRVLTIMTPSER